MEQTPTPRGAPCRVRCPNCKAVDLITIPRSNGYLMVPGRVVCVKCGGEPKIISPGMRKLIRGETTL